MRSTVCAGAAALITAALLASRCRPDPHHHAARAVRPQLRRRLLPRQLPADCRLLAEARRAVRSHGAAGDRQDGRRAPAAHGDRHVAGEPQEARALQGDLGAAGARRGADRRRRRARWRRRARPSSGSTAACTPPRRSARSSSARWSTRWSAAPTTRRCGSSTTSSSSSCTRIPDGNDLVADWYMREPDPQKRTSRGLPRLYQKYIGHDNNRDFFASTQAETENMNRVLYHEWFPQILYNHHQSGPAGTVFWSPPLRDPFNYNLDPLARARHPDGRRARCTRGSPPRASRARRCARAGRTTAGGTAACATPATFHNMIAHAHRDDRQPDADAHPARDRAGRFPTAIIAFPIAPQEWHFRQSIDYSISLNRAVLDYASRNAREPAVQHLRDGAELDRARQPRTRGRRITDAAGEWSPARMAARWRARRRRRSGDAERLGRAAPARDCAIRAATSSRRTSRTSRPRRSSSTRCSR